VLRRWGTVGSRPASSKPADDRALTLIELMVVVLVIAILLAIAIPTLLGVRTRAQDAAARADLGSARSAAAATNDVPNAVCPALGTDEGALTYLDATTTPTGRSISVLADGTDWAAARWSQSGTCFGIAVVNGVSYGPEDLGRSGPCTGHSAASGAPARAASPTVPDGSFEADPPFVGTYFATFPVGPVTGGWSVVAGEVDIQRTAFFQPNSGDRSLDNNGWVTGTIQRTVNATGEPLVLRFASAANPGSAVPVSTRVWWNGAIVATLTPPLGGSHLAVPWRLHRITLPAAVGPTTLQFESTNAGTGGVIFDDVSILPR
jgi:type IV pilus assembly protein PilA